MEGNPPDRPAEALGSPRAVPTRTRTFVAVAIVLLVVAAGGIAVSYGYLHHSAPTSRIVLVANGTSYSIPVGQYNAVSFIAPSNSTINGTIYETFGLTLYRMTPTQYEHLVITLNLSAGYEWTSGVLGNNTVYQFALSVPSGQWEIVFANPNGQQTLITTLVGFYTDLVLNPA
jgi:hypothetical protein